MYRVGFGDCFLLSLPAGNAGADGYKHFVIDCGVHGKGHIGTIGQAVDNIREVTGGKIAVVIATHSHQDHISGFSEKFSQFEIEEVWLPWSENQKDELAVKWGKKQASLVQQLEQHFAAQAQLGASEASTPIREKALAALVNLNSSEETMQLLVNRLGAAGANSLSAFSKLTSNAEALRLLNAGFNVGAKVRYLEAGNILKEVCNIAGLEVQVLGPPRDEKFLSKMNPPESQRYLRADGSGGQSFANKLEPFAAKWQADYKKNKSEPPLSKQEENELERQISDTALDSLAFALDSAKNNTSLVTLFVYRGQYLLFPGDAQYGNWKYWLDKEADEILPHISFLKVAHHGSHNATPKDALEKMSAGGLAAMVSTQSIPWDSIPRIPLMTRLDQQTKKRMVRSDWIQLAGAPDPFPDSIPVKPKKNPKGFKQSGFWYDYEIEVT